MEETGWSCQMIFDLQKHHDVTVESTADLVVKHLLVWTRQNRTTIRYLDGRHCYDIRGCTEVQGDLDLVAGPGFDEAQPFDIVLRRPDGVATVRSVYLLDVKVARVGHDRVVKGKFAAASFEPWISTVLTCQKTEPRAVPVDMSKRIFSCRCDQCQSACRWKPGWFRPEEIEPAAALLDLTVEEFFKQYLAVDWWEASPPIYVLAPALRGKPTGDLYPDQPLGHCIFHGLDGDCAIHTWKPFECQSYTHDQGNAEVIGRHRAVADAWVDHQDMIVKLLGRKP